MTPFALIVSWDGRKVSTREAVRLLEPVRFRCTDGSMATSVPGAAVAVGLRIVVPGESFDSGLLVDRERCRLIVGDFRLYGRVELVRQLGMGNPGDSDIRLVALAIDRFGEDAPTRLVGDFAFVVLDWSSGKLWAARDHFGTRSLHHRTLPDGIALATDVRQLLAIGEPAEATLPGLIDPDSALNYLVNIRGHRGRTYFRGITPVLPAHRILAGRDGIRQTRYWRPPSRLIDKRRYDDYLIEWRHIFQTAVRERLVSAFPIAAHLSGGLDSGAIVGAAHEFYGAGSSEGRPCFFTLSAIFPGLDCDETAYIDATMTRAPLFESVRWNGCRGDSSDLESPLINSPGLPRGPRIGPWGDVEAARARAARVLLIGEGGDEVGWSRGIFPEILRRGRVLTLLGELAQLDSWSRRRRWFADALRGLVPQSVKDWRREHAFGARECPPWLTPQLAGRFPGVQEVDSAKGFAFSSQVQRDVWRSFTSESSYSALDVLVPVAADSGLEIRIPFLDVRLVDYVLAIPWIFRLPGGDMRRLERDGVRPLVSPMVAARMVKPIFGAAIRNQIRLNLSLIREIIGGETWLSGPFVNQTGAKARLASCLRTDEEVLNSKAWRQVWKIASFEVWLRTVSAYSAQGGTHGTGPSWK